MLVSASLWPGAVAEAVATPRGLHESGQFLAGSPPAALSYRSAQDVWTPERIADTPPLELERDGSVTTSQQPASRLFPRDAELFNSVEINKAAEYPNRVHGKLVGTFPGLGDYACSATVVNSGSGSLLTTAGHCAYDVPTKTLATNLAFVPGYQAGSIPFGVWPVGAYILTKRFARGDIDYDFSMMRTIVSPFGTLQGIVGARGIGFNQPRKQRLEAYGYPGSGRPSYDGAKLIRCDSGYVPDPAPRTSSVGMHCDQQQGASGGGWVAQHSFVVSNTSHGYPQINRTLFYGPYYGAVAKALYRANTPSWPSIGPVKCGGQVATIIATGTGDRIRGSDANDVIATDAGNDKISGGGGNDLICGGDGNDKIDGGSGKDKIDGGAGNDKCGKGKGGGRLHACEGGGGKGK
ncbi:MAG: hypothetical protein H0V25_03285 [Solirubrobacterales bacterium]|nr:hypothetical protein [Solirubrobacterales bacterium]